MEDKVSVSDAGKGLEGSNLAIDFATNSSLTPKFVSGLVEVRFRLSGVRSGLVDK